jgi:hypothetical protein
VTEGHSLAARERFLQGLRGEGPAGLSEPEWGEVLELARRHGVVPLLHRRMKARYGELEVPGPVQVQLRDTYRATGIRNTRLFAQLNGVLRAFREAGIDVVALKGAHLAELVYEEVALRPMGDVDLLVRASDLRRATELLRSLGYASGEGERQHQDPIDENLHLKPMRKPGGLLIELHYAIAIPERMKDPDVEGIWSRVEPARIGGAEAFVLSPEDLLLHLCIHASLHHGFEVSLLHLCDIPVVVDHFQARLDWAVFWERARTWGAERSALVTFALTERLLGWRRPDAAAAPGGTLPAAPFDAVAVAERLIFDEGPAFARSAHLPRLWGDASVGEKARLVLGRAFPSRAEVGFMYGVPAGSWKVPMLYPLRTAHLLKRYTMPVVRAVRGDEASRASIDVAKERSRLVEWLGDR